MGLNLPTPHPPPPLNNVKKLIWYTYVRASRSYYSVVLLGSCYAIFWDRSRQDKKELWLYSSPSDLLPHSRWRFLPSLLPSPSLAFALPALHQSVEPSQAVNHLKSTGAAFHQDRSALTTATAMLVPFARSTATRWTIPTPRTGLEKCAAVINKIVLFWKYTEVIMHHSLGGRKFY